MSEKLLQWLPTLLRATDSHCSYLQLLQLPTATSATYSYCSYQQLLQLPTATAATYSYCSYQQLLQLPTATAATDSYCSYQQPLQLPTATAATDSYCSYRQLLQLPTATDVGVPQGSSLGQLLFTLYVVPLTKVTISFGAKHHQSPPVTTNHNQYADDTYLYIFASKEKLTTGVQTIKTCVDFYTIGCLTTALRLTPQSLKSSSSASLRLDTPRTLPQSSLLAHRYPWLTLRASVLIRFVYDIRTRRSYRVQGMIFHIRALHHIRASISDDVDNIVSARLDYCNSLLAIMSETNLAKLQCIRNTLARVVTVTRRYDHDRQEVVHNTPALAKPHWLPVNARVSFKLATMV